MPRRSSRTCRPISPEDWANWEVGTDGLYFRELCGEHKEPTVVFLAFGSTRAVHLAPLPEQGWSGFSVAPDGSWLGPEEVEQRRPDELEGISQADPGDESDRLERGAFVAVDRRPLHVARRRRGQTRHVQTHRGRPALPVAIAVRTHLLNDVRNLVRTGVSALSLALADVVASSVVADVERRQDLLCELDLRLRRGAESGAAERRLAHRVALRRRDVAMDDRCRRAAR